MKILLLNQTFYPEQFATSQQVTDFALFLTSKGHLVSVFTGRRGYEDKRKTFLKSEVWKGIQIERIQSTGFGKVSVLKRIIDSFTFDCMLFLKLILTPKVDLVVSFTSPPLIGVLGSLFCFIKGGRSVQWLMDVNPDAAFAVGYIRQSSICGRILRAAFKWTLNQSSNVVVLDRWMKDLILKYGVCEDKITIIPPWSVIEVKLETKRDQQGHFRKTNGLEQKFIILYSGNHSVAHPLDTLLAAALALKECDDIQFVFAGSGLRTDDVRNFKEKHGLRNITQLPWQTREALKDTFRSVDLHLVVMGDHVSGLVHTSKIYSILSSGRPYLFIGPEKSHVVDLIKECPGGKHVEHGDVTSLIQQLLWFKALPDADKIDMGQKNTAYLKTHFGPEVSKSRFERHIIFSAPIVTPTSLRKDAILNK